MQYEPRSAVTGQEECLPGCCAANVLHNLRYENAESLHAALREFVANGGYGNEWEGGPPGMVLYATTDEQPEIEEALKAHGFTTLATFLSPRSGRTIILHGLVVNQDVRPKKKRTTRQRSGRRRPR